MDAESQSTGKIIPADKDGMALLYSQMESDAEFKKLLTAPVNEDSRYWVLVTKISIYLSGASLLDIIEIATSKHNFGALPFFYVRENKIKAFFACFIKDDVVEHVIVFSFSDVPYGLLAEDLVFFIKENLYDYREIQWVVSKSNPANSQYLKAFEMLTENGCKLVDDDNRWLYVVPGLKK